MYHRSRSLLLTYLSGTLAGPRQSRGSDVRSLREDLEPHGASPVPGVGSLARRHLCHVELESTRVRDRRLGREANGRPGGHRHDLGALVSGRELVAAEGVRVHVGHWPVALVVGGLSNILPVCGRLAVRDERGEGVCLGSLSIFFFFIGIQCIMGASYSLTVRINGRSQSEKSCNDLHSEMRATEYRQRGRNY